MFDIQKALLLHASSPTTIYCQKLDLGSRGSSPVAGSMALASVNLKQLAPKVVMLSEITHNVGHLAFKVTQCPPSLVWIKGLYTTSY